jgi:hypothetical protein
MRNASLKQELSKVAWFEGRRSGMVEIIDLPFHATFSWVQRPS